MRDRQPFVGPSFTVAEAVGAIAWSVEAIVLPRSELVNETSTSVRGADALWLVTATWPNWSGKATSDATADDASNDAVGLAVQLNRLSVTSPSGLPVGIVPPTRFASPSASYSRTPVTGLDAVGDRRGAGRLSGLTNGRFIAAGASARFGDDATFSAPRGAGRPAEGMTRLSIHARQARSVDLCGDWNGWTPVTASRADDDIWYVDVPLRPGVYQYAFRINDREWRVPDDAVTVKDGFGWLSACVTVAGRAGSGSASTKQP